MTGYLNALQDEAERAVAAMKEAALAARLAHARAELMRHMLTTARKLCHRPRRRRSRASSPNGCALGTSRRTPGRMSSARWRQ
jgi:hypothetical protein